MMSQTGRQGIPLQTHPESTVVTGQIDLSSSMLTVLLTAYLGTPTFPCKVDTFRGGRARLPIKTEQFCMW